MSFRRCAGWEQSIFNLGKLVGFNELFTVDYHTAFDIKLHWHVCLAVIDRRFNASNLIPVKQSSICCLSCNQERMVWRPAAYVARV